MTLGWNRPSLFVAGYPESLAKAGVGSAIAH
jgi:hypothetical protein